MKPLIFRWLNHSMNQPPVSPVPVNHSLKTWQIHLLSLDG